MEQTYLSYIATKGVDGPVWEGGRLVSCYEVSSHGGPDSIQRDSLLGPMLAVRTMCPVLHTGHR